MPGPLVALPIALALLRQPSAEDPLHLEWNAPAECPDTTAIRDMVARTLGDGYRFERPMNVQGRVRTDPQHGFVLTLEVDGGEGGQRQLHGPACDELSEAAALVIAMAIDPRALERLSEQDETPAVPPAEAVPEDEPTESEPTESEPTESEPTESEPTESEPTDPASNDGTLLDDLARADKPRPEPAPERSLAFVGRFDGGVSGGPVPGAGGIIGLGAGVAGRYWRAEVVASYAPPRTRASPNNDAVGMRAQTWNVGAQGCGEPIVGPVTLPICVGLLGGLVHAVGTGNLQPARVARRWLAATLEPGVVWWARPRLGISLRGRGHAALFRPQFRTDPSGVVFEVPSVGGSLRAGLELRFP